MSVPQPHLTVSRADVERIVRRDFPPDQFATVMATLDEYGKEDWHLERDRVQLAALKLAGGNIETLRGEVELAKSDYRDVLAHAEYPAYIKILFPNRLSAEEQRQIVDRDWKQYEDWFTRA